MATVGFWYRIMAALQAFVRPQGPHLGANDDFADARQERPEGGFPPGTRPVIMESEEAAMPGFPELRFRRTRCILRDQSNAKYTSFHTNRILLTGCNCFVSGPNEVAYLSDISGKPVCRRCATVCICGHKVAPNERVMVGRRSYLCNVCHDKEQRRQRMESVKQFILGPFIRRQ